MKLGLIISSVFNLVIIIMLMQNEGSCNGCLENERIGLLEIKHYILSQKKGDPYNELVSWVDDDRDSNCCSWNRVKCSNTSSGHITHLSLNLLLDSGSSNMMNVSLFRPFQELRLLDLSFNNLQGWTDNQGFARLQKLETLDLSYNNLNSSMLSSLNGLTDLKTLDLGSNSIYRFSAQGFARLQKLETLDLSYNKLNNTSILSSLNGLTALTTLNLRGNNFDSFSAQDVRNLRNLKFLSLSSNHMNDEGLCHN